MIYHYFGNKEGLYLAALERVYEELRGTEDARPCAISPPTAAIRRLVEFTFDYSRGHPELISLINNENLHRARHLRKGLPFSPSTSAVNASAYLRPSWKM